MTGRQTVVSTVVPPADQLDWRDVVERVFLPLEPATHGVTPGFRGRIDADRVGPCGLTLVTAQEHRIVRTEQGIGTQDPGTLFVNLQLSGDALIAQSGVSTTIHAGDVAVLDTSAPFSIRFGRAMRLACLSLPKDFCPDLDRRTGYVRAAWPEGAVVAVFLRGLLCSTGRLGPKPATRPRACSPTCLAERWPGRWSEPRPPQPARSSRCCG